jgi:hypothetical protein
VNVGGQRGGIGVKGEGEGEGEGDFVGQSYRRWKMNATSWV